jgi:hypothetical protein
MQKRIKKQDVRPNLLVVVTDHPEATVYTVESIEGNQVTLTWYEGTNQCISGMDYSMLMRPTIEQVEYSINNNGRLATAQDVADVKLLIG